jgi:uncharacterized protein (TIGR02996 family)
MSMLEQFLDELARSPDDWALRGVFADWCEDNRQPALAACLRWMARRRKRAYRGAAGRGTWFNADTIGPDLRDRDPESNVPGLIFGLLEGGRAVANHKVYPSVRAAEEAFHAAWLRARAGGWDPDV